MKFFLNAPFRRMIRNHLISGLFILVPVWVTYVVVIAAFNAMASVLLPLVEQLLPGLHNHYWAKLAISILAFVVLVLLVGIVAGRVVGLRFLAWGESLILRIPVVKSIYSAAKQVMEAISLQKEQTFKSVVLIEYPRPGIRIIGFLTGITADEDKRKWGRVFLPMSPLPTSGFLQLVPVEEIRIANITVEEAFKMLISGGYIAPETLETHPFADEGC